MRYTYLDKLGVQGVNCSLCFLRTVAVLNTEEEATIISTTLTSTFSFIEHLLFCLITYTFVYFLSDADKSVGQSAGAALILWLSRGVVAEHSLDVETQDKT